MEITLNSLHGMLRKNIETQMCRYHVAICRLSEERGHEHSAFGDHPRAAQAFYNAVRHARKLRDEHKEVEMLLRCAGSHEKQADALQAISTQGSLVIDESIFKASVIELVRATSLLNSYPELQNRQIKLAIRAENSLRRLPELWRQWHNHNPSMYDRDACNVLLRVERKYLHMREFRLAISY